MLLALDVGNTNVTVGLFRGAALVRTFRMATRRHATADEYGVALLRLLRTAGPGEPVEGVALASVVPPLTGVMAEVCRRYLGAEPLVVGSHLRTLPGNLYDDPQALGADRLANAVAAWTLYGRREAPPSGWPPAPAAGPVVAVDFGTATKLEVVSAEGVYLGGAIAPGIGISIQALRQAAARLPQFSLRRPDRVLGRDNAAALRSGFVYGFAGQVDGLVERIREELGAEPVVVTTGGLAHLVVGESRSIQHHDPGLTLAGIRLIWEWNRAAGGSPA
nr:MAG: type III pantothenate kinase [Bacillota bacterium]